MQHINNLDSPGYDSEQRLFTRYYKEFQDVPFTKSEGFNFIPIDNPDNSKESEFRPVNEESLAKNVEKQNDLHDLHVDELRESKQSKHLEEERKISKYSFDNGLEGFRRVQSSENNFQPEAYADMRRNIQKEDHDDMKHAGGLEEFSLCQSKLISQGARDKSRSSNEEQKYVDKSKGGSAGVVGKAELLECGKNLWEQESEKEKLGVLDLREKSDFCDNDLSQELNVEHEERKSAMNMSRISSINLLDKSYDNQNNDLLEIFELLNFIVCMIATNQYLEFTAVHIPSGTVFSNQFTNEEVLKISMGLMHSAKEMLDDGFRIACKGFPKLSISISDDGKISLNCEDTIGPIKRERSITFPLKELQLKPIDACKKYITLTSQMKKSSNQKLMNKLFEKIIDCNLAIEEKLEKLLQKIDNLESQLAIDGDKAGQASGEKEQEIPIEEKKVDVDVDEIRSIEGTKEICPDDLPEEGSNNDIPTSFPGSFSLGQFTIRTTSDEEALEIEAEHTITGKFYAQRITREDLIKDNSLWESPIQLESIIHSARLGEYDFSLTIDNNAKMTLIVNTIIERRQASITYHFELKELDLNLTEICSKYLSQLSEIPSGSQSDLQKQLIMTIQKLTEHSTKREKELREISEKIDLLFKQSLKDQKEK